MPMGLIAALDGSTILWWIDVIVKVGVGLGAVILVHELGHFLVAKAFGVKCEKFMIGFDIGGYKISRRWGETEYGIGILPLGGYVKMLGQDDDPAHIAEQMQKSQVGASNPDAVPITGPNGETYHVDRRSYLAKSVPQRMAIISAGVIMNVIFAFLFAVVAYGMGVSYTPCIVSETVPGSPAWRVGIEPGDEIVKIGDRVNPTFMQLMGGVTLGDRENGIECVVRRAADGQLTSRLLKPEQEPGRLAVIGVRGPLSLTLSKLMGQLADSSAAAAQLIDPAAGTLPAGDAKLKGGDRVVRVGDTPVSSYRELAAILARQPDQPLLIVVERTVKKAAGQADDASAPAAATADDAGAPVAHQENEVASADPPQRPRDSVQTLTFELPPQPLRDFGLVMVMGPIVAVQENSPASAAGLKVGDVIETVDGQPAGADAAGNVAWTPDRLPDVLRQAAVDGREVEFVVKRPDAAASKDSEAGGEMVTVRIKPQVPISFYSAVPPGAPQGSEALGIAWQIENTVAAVLPAGPAQGADIAPGDKLVSARLLYPNDADGKEVKPDTVELGTAQRNWMYLVTAMQLAPAETVVEFTLAREGKPDGQLVQIQATPVEGRYVPVRGLVFEPFEQVRTATNLVEQIQLGWDETVDALTMVFRFLRKLGTQVPITMLGGPGTIAVAAGGAASQGLSSLLVFLTMLSANLAVINFLPIPLLDGGHMVFLAYEGLRGRPANEKIVVALHTAGFVFIVTLMLFVIGLDIQRWLFT